MSGIISAGARASKEILMKNQPAGAYKLLIQPNKYGDKGGLVVDKSQAFLSARVPVARILLFQLRKQRTIMVGQLAQGQSQNWDASWELLTVSDLSDVSEVCPTTSRPSLTLSPVS